MPIGPGIGKTVYESRLAMVDMPYDTDIDTRNSYITQMGSNLPIEFIIRPSDNIIYRPGAGVFNKNVARIDQF